MLGGADDVDALLEGYLGTCGVVAGNAVGAYHLHGQRAFLLGGFIHVNVDDVIGLCHDTRGAGEASEGVGHR